MIDLFIIASPLQALNAAEAREAFGSDDNIVVVVESACENTNAQIYSIIAHDQWREVLSVHVVRGLLRTKYANVGDVVSTLSRTPTRHMFIGHYVDIMLHFANVIPHCRTYLLDDGTATISVSRSLERGLDVPVLRGTVMRRYVRPGLVKYVDRLIVDDIASPYYFTMFDQLISGGGARVCVNSLQRLKRRVSAAGTSEEVWFLGCWTEPLFKRRSRYVELIGELAAHVGRSRFRYVAHSREYPSMLQALRARCGVTVLELGAPVELALLDAEIVPRQVWGLFSSALYTVGSIFRGLIEVSAVRVDLAELRRCYRGFVQEVFSYYNTVPFIEVRRADGVGQGPRSE